MCIIDSASREVAHTLSGHRGGVYGVAWSADGTQVASTSADKTVKVWDVATGECVRSVSVMPEGKAAGKGDMQVALRWRAGKIVTLSLVRLRVAPCAQLGGAHVRACVCRTAT